MPKRITPGTDRATMSHDQLLAEIKRLEEDIAALEHEVIGWTVTDSERLRRCLSIHGLGAPESLEELGLEARTHLRRLFGAIERAADKRAQQAGHPAP